MSWRKVIQTVKSGFFSEHHVCPWWLAYTFDNPLRRFLHDPRTILSPYLKEGMAVADIGCGMGYFTISLTRLVGKTGKVTAVDIQQKMLERVRKRAEKEEVNGRIRLVLASKDDIGIREPVDFVLAFWMVHETGDIARFFKQVSLILKEHGKMFIAEPRLHVSGRKFREILKHAQDAGFTISARPAVRMSRGVVLSRSATGST